MARKKVSVADVINASAAIVAENSGKIEFEAWKAAMNARLETDVSQLIGQLMKKKTFILWLAGVGEGGKPSLYVVDKLPSPEA